MTRTCSLDHSPFVSPDPCLHGPSGSTREPRMLVRIATLVVAAIASCASGRASAQTNWTLASAYPAENFHSQNLVRFANEVAEATGGKLYIKVHPGAALYTAPDIKRVVENGHAEMGEVL